MNTLNTPDPDVEVLRLLVPINANEDSRWGIRYALRRQREGRAVEVILLNVGEPITEWEVLRFRTQQEIARFQEESAQRFIGEATAPLMTASIPCRGIFRQGELVFSILDSAEESGCHEIVMPRSMTGLSRCFSRDIVRAVKRGQRDIPVVAVDDDGMGVS
ncbi:MAG: universal stress protein [Pseudomonadota bacterium]